LFGSVSVADPGCFVPDPIIFSSRIRLQTFSHPVSRILHGKWYANLPVLFFASYAFRSKVLVIVKKIRDPERNSSRIQEVKKHRIRICNTGLSGRRDEDFVNIRSISVLICYSTGIFKSSLIVVAVSTRDLVTTFFFF
jgi:hypothetical protein